MHNTCLSNSGELGTNRPRHDELHLPTLSKADKATLSH